MKILHSAKFVGFESLESKTRRGDLETVPFDARRYSSTPSNRINRERRRGGREHRLPWLRGEKRKGGRDQQGETKEWRTAVDELCRVPSLLHSFSSSPLLSPRHVPFHPLNPTQKASLSAATPASFRRLITYARERPAQAYESSRWRWAKPSE